MFTPEPRTHHVEAELVHLERLEQPPTFGRARLLRHGLSVRDDGTELDGGRMGRDDQAGMLRRGRA